MNNESVGDRPWTPPRPSSAVQDTATSALNGHSQKQKIGVDGSCKLKRDLLLLPHLTKV